MTPKEDGVSQDVLDAVFERARDNERRCTGCAQSTVAALLDTLDIKADDVFRAASGLADGVGLTTDGSCGALTGGVMVLGLAHGASARSSVIRSPP